MHKLRHTNNSLLIFMPFGTPYYFPARKQAAGSQSGVILLRQGFTGLGPPHSIYTRLRGCRGLRSPAGTRNHVFRPGKADRAPNRSKTWLRRPKGASQTTASIARTYRTPSWLPTTNPAPPAAFIEPLRKPSSLRARTGCWSLRMALASTCRTRSRVTLKIRPTSSSV